MPTMLLPAMMLPAWMPPAQARTVVSLQKPVAMCEPQPGGNKAPQPGEIVDTVGDGAADALLIDAVGDGIVDTVVPLSKERAQQGVRPGDAVDTVGDGKLDSLMLECVYGTRYGIPVRVSSPLNSRR